MSTWLNPGLVILVGAFIVASGGYWQFRQQASRARELMAKTQEIADLNRELKEKSDEVAKLAKEGVAVVLGGDSFGYLEPRFGNGAVSYFLRINREAKYPVYDVLVFIYDVTPPVQTPIGKLVLKEPFGTLTGNINWHQVVYFPAPQSSDGPKQYRVEVAFRSGVLVQELILKPKHGAWSTNSRKMTHNGKVVPVPEDFPKEDLP